MLLIFAHHHDAEADWLRRQLEKESPLPVYLLMPEALGVDYSISLHLKNDGPHRSTVFFHQPAIRLELSDAWYAINRLSYVDPLVWRNAAPGEKIYATSELNSFFPALIHSLTCPVSNRIHHGSLYGDRSFAARWADQLNRHQIPVNPLALDQTGKLFERLNATPLADLYRVMYFDEQLILPPTQPPLRGFGKLKASILEKGGSETLEFIFLRRGSTAPELLHISKTPSLSYYGKRFTDALVQRREETLHDHPDGHTQRNAVATAR